MNRDAELARTILRTQKFRAEEFDNSLFGDVAWNMLLTLFIADAEGRRLTGRQLINACPVKFEEGRRWTAHLNNVGLVVGDGQGDVDDVLTISDIGLSKMERFMSHAREAYAAS